MTKWLLDTNILSELRRPKADRNVVAFVAAQALETIYVSTVTFAEIRYGIERIVDPMQRLGINDWLVNVLRPMFAQRVLPLTEDIIFTLRLLIQKGRSSGHTFSQPDLFIAATAVHHGLTVVTRDVGDFQKTGVAWYNPWLSPSTGQPPR